MASSLIGFALIYFPHYFTLEMADFHPELFSLLQDPKEMFLAITGFRGSAKSTIAGTIDILYEALIRQNPFIIPVNETSEVVKLTIANIREELEHNELIIEDFGNQIIDKKKPNTFTETNVLLANGVRIMGRSRGQKIRGLRHKQHRPGHVVIDDPEEREKVGKKEYRDKTERWVLNDLIPAIEESRARLVVLGNLLHSDSLMARLRDNKIFNYRAYPLITGDVLGQEIKWENCTWKGKYPSLEALKKQELKVGHIAWMQEYLLQVIAPEEQEVKEEWIKYYDVLPSEPSQAGVGVDLAISKNQTADYTTMVSGLLTVQQGVPKLFILPNPVNEHFTFHETLEQMKSLNKAMMMYAAPTFYIEDVAYQKAAIQEAQNAMLPVIGMHIGTDKRSRLRTAATFIQNGTVVFPKSGCENLIAQLLGFGIEKHDDLCDAFTLLVMGLADSGGSTGFLDWMRGLNKQTPQTAEEKLEQEKKTNPAQPRGLADIWKLYKGGGGTRL